MSILMVLSLDGGNAGGALSIGASLMAIMRFGRGGQVFHVAAVINSDGVSHIARR